jgi:hypothetical protein
MLRLGSGISSATVIVQTRQHLAEGPLNAWNLNALLTMSAAIRSANSKSAIEHASQEDEAVARIAGLVVPFAPDEGMAGVT